jgi:hypothetical protein
MAADIHQFKKSQYYLLALVSVLHLLQCSPSLVVESTPKLQTLVLILSERLKQAFLKMIQGTRPLLLTWLETT